MAFKRKPPQGNVRRVRCTGKNIRGVVTNKTNRIVQYESYNEFKLILLLERDPSVLDFISQPEQFEFFGSDGKHHTYTPDFKVLKVDGSIEIHEVTILKRTTKENMILREQAGRNICRERGWKYILHTEKTLPSPTEMANLSTMYGFKPTAYYVEPIAQTIRRYLAKGMLDATTLITQVSFAIQAPEVIVSGCVYHMLWRNDLVIATKGLLMIDGYPNPKMAIALRP